MKKATDKEQIKIEKALYHLQDRFATEKDAQSALKKLCKSWKYHQVTTIEIEAHKKYLAKGRPAEDSPFEIEYQIKFQFEKNEQQIEEIIRKKACFIVGRPSTIGVE